MRQRRVLLAVLTVTTLACATATIALAEAISPGEASLFVTTILAFTASAALAALCGGVLLLVRTQSEPARVLRSCALAVLLVTTALVLRSRELFDAWTFLPLILAAVILEFAARTRRTLPHSL